MKSTESDSSEREMRNKEAFSYERAFEINLGIFSKAQQANIRKARILIVGAGGVGGVTAIILARTGVNNFVINDIDKFDPTNMNRQIGCFVDTIGRYKAEVIKEEILRINPEANVKHYNRRFDFDELAELLQECDVFIPTADDFVYDAKAIMLAQKLKKLTVAWSPAGLWGYVTTFPPDSKSIIDPCEIFGSPHNISELDYDALNQFMENPFNRGARRWYLTSGKWRVGWFNKWRNGEVSHAQLCPSVWLGASLACIEVVKYLTGKWKPVKAPKIWHLQPADNRIRVELFRRRTRYFNKIISFLMNIRLMNIGKWIKNNTSKQLSKELKKLEQQENDGKKVKYPFFWRFI
ncbi:ThiF family adenylyltransferase [Chloroflexota bacterium]